jgi:uncharacterized membrane protein YphA (DoxX/SURF4 family)
MDFNLEHTMDILLLIGRLLFSYLFLHGAYGHFKRFAMISNYTRAKGVPFPRLMVVLTSIMIVVGAASVVLGFHGRIGAALLALFLLPTAFIMHNYWSLSDPMARANDQAHFLKDIALAGCALMLAVQGTGAFSIAG